MTAVEAPQSHPVGAGIDLGATNMRLEVRRGDVVLHELRTPVADARSFKELLDRAIEGCPVPIDRCCVAVAGPVDPGRTTARMTNLGWRIDARDVPAGATLVVNDVEAAAAGTLALSDDELVWTHGHGLRAADRAVVSVGTGLGVAHLMRRSVAPSTRPGARATWEVRPAESGHRLWAPTTERDWAVHSALLRLRPPSAVTRRISCEDVISGPGLVAVFNALSCVDGRSEDDAATPGSVALLAAAGHPGALESFEVMARALGGFAADTVLDGAWGGLVLAGGVFTKNRGLLASSAFLQAYLAAGALDERRRTVPVAAVPPGRELGLEGAVTLAAAQIRADDVVAILGDRDHETGSRREP